MKIRCKSRMQVPPRGFLLAVFVGGLFLFGNFGTAADLEPAKERLNEWLQRQAAIETWSADVLQIRKLQTLVQPLEAEGRVWFSQPNRFRWQLGDPPRTIAVRTAEALLIAYPRLKRVEKFPLDGGLEPSWRYVMALLDVGFPSDPQRFYDTYDLTGAENVDGRWRFNLRPASAEARQLLESVHLEVSAADPMLQATELAFPDGSIMRNEFRNIAVNPDVAPEIFALEIPQDYQVVNPLAGSEKNSP